MIKIIMYRFFSICLLLASFLNGEDREYKYVLSFNTFQNNHENQQADPYERIKGYKADCVLNNSRSDLYHYSVSQLKNYFVHHHYTEKDILSCSILFMSNEFVKLAKELSGYEEAIIFLHRNFQKKDWMGKLLGVLNGTYCKGLKKRINYLYRDVQRHQNKQKEVINEASKLNKFVEVAPMNCSEHKDLVNTVTAINVQEVTVNILENNDNQIAVAHEFGKVSDQVLANARHCKFVFVAEVESHVNQSIDTIKTTNNRQVFIFHIAMVDRVLGDVQAKVDLVAGKPTLLERSPELFVRAVGKFFERLNPLVQAQELGGLAMDIGSGLYNALEHTVMHPIATAENVGMVTQQGVAFLRNTADFVSDITVGRLYLPEEEYQQRVDTFRDGINAIPVDQLQQLTAENWVDLGAHVAADFVFCKGFGSAFIYLKEIDAMSKVQQQAAKVAQVFKKAVDTHLADNPILVTAEGVVIKMSKKKQDFGGAAKNIIGSSQVLLESAWAKVAIKFENEIEAIRITYDKKLDGFGLFAHKKVKIDYKHILGIDIEWAETGEALKLNGFHHNLNNSLGKRSGLNIIKKSTNIHGCYKADIIIGNAEFRGKTFFPDHWSREKVIDNICEAYDNFKKSGLEPEFRKGKYHITGLTNEGVSIKMHITQKGEILSAYPKI